ncbi:MAG: hypothetical protein ACPGOV_10760 [Magnetovibrionaceae bacterium]
MMKTQETAVTGSGVDITAQSKVNLIIGAIFVCSGLWGLVASAMIA